MISQTFSKSFGFGGRPGSLPPPPLPVDPHWRYVSTLLHCNGANGSTTFTDVKGATWTSVAGAAISTTQSKFGGASAFFDNADDAVTTPSTSALQLNGVDFTIEAWVYLTSAADWKTIVSKDYVPGSAYWSYVFAVMADRRLRFATGDGSSTATPQFVDSAAGVIPLNTWTHVVAQRRGSNYELYVNGILLVSAAVTTAVGANNRALSFGRLPETSLSFAGYIDEFRITKGLARYSSNFTPPTEAFPDIGTDFSNVSSLLHFDGADGATTFTDVAGVLWSRAGTASISTAQSKFGGASGYFNAAQNSEIFTTTTSVASAKVLTIESWIYLTSTPGIYGAPIFGQGGAGGMTDQFLRVTSDLALLLYRGVNLPGGALELTTAANVISLNTWAHVAMVMDGVLARIFVNGIQVASISNTAGWVDTTKPFRIGRNVVESYEIYQSYFDGYIDDFRITKNVARYTSNFAPPTSAFPDADKDFASVTSLLHFDGTDGSTTFTDITGKIWSPAGTAQIDTAQSKFGGASGLFGGGWIASASSEDFNIISGNFTFEFFCRHSSTSGNQGMVESYLNNNNRWNISLVDGALNFYTLVGSVGSTKITTTAPAVDTWHHIALVKDGSTFTLYVNGTAVGTSTTTSYYAGAVVQYVGTSGAGSTPYNGHIDELRITKGIARYTANFTPPTSAFLNV